MKNAIKVFGLIARHGRRCANALGGVFAKQKLQRTKLAWYPQPSRIAAKVPLFMPILFAITFGLAGCPDGSTGGNGPPSGGGGGITSISEFKDYLDDLDVNTAETPYVVKLDIGDLGGAYNTAGSLGNALYANNTKFVSLDLSGSTITGIDNSAFENCYSLKSVTIGSGVTTIGTSAFENCGLTSVTIPNSVTSIGNQAFSRCGSLVSVTIGSGVTSIGTGAFSGCFRLESFTVAPNNPNYASEGGILYNKAKTQIVLMPQTISESFTIPDSVTSIGGGAFSGCTGLTSVTIGNGVTTIDSYAFNGCRSLTSVTIGSGVTTIGTSAFDNCIGLTSVTVDPNNPNYASEDGILYDKEKTEMVAVPGAISGSVTIPDSVTTIGNSAFSGCTGLTSVTIGNGVTSIGNQAFYGCTGLTGIEIPDGVTTIESYVFQNCTGLTSVTIPDSVTSIGYSAFNGCSSLTNVTIPDSVTTIAGSAFDGCTGLTSVTIGNGVTTIDMYAFQNCTGLTDIEIPDSVTTIGNSAFAYCTGLTSFTVDTNNPNFASEDGILYDKAKTEMVAVPGAISGSVTIPDSVTSIGNRAFAYCRSLTSVTIGSGVTTIGTSAFDNCIGLTSVTIPASVTSIGDTVFFSCTSLTSITIPDSVTTIGNSAFAYCTSLASVTFEGASTTIAADNSFPNGASLRALYPSGGIGTYTRDNTTVPIPNTVEWVKK